MTYEAVLLLFTMLRTLHTHTMLRTLSTLVRRAFHLKDWRKLRITGNVEVLRTQLLSFCLNGNIVICLQFFVCNTNIVLVPTLKKS